jgi:1-phosphofructokinase family hexose kinase
MLLAFTPNPALDRTLLAPGFRSAGVARVAEARPAAGGKGVNVARVARSLGEQAKVCAPLAGDAGRAVAELARAEGLEAAWCWLPAGETRTCTLVVDPAGDDLALNERGPEVSGAAWGEVARVLRREAAFARAVACCGSLPPGVPAESYVRTLQSLLDDGARIALDTSGEALREALALPLTLLKVNADELGAALGRELATPADALAAAEQVRRGGIALVVVTLGAQGAVAAGADGRYTATPPPIRPISTIGSGDAFLAGLLTALLRDDPLPDALRLAVACGAVNALHIGGGVVTREEVEEMTGRVEVTR